MEGLLNFCRKAKVLIPVPYLFEIKTPFGSQKFNLIQRSYVDAY